MGKTNKSKSDFWRWTPLAPPVFYFMSLDIENSLSEPQANIRARPPKGSRSILLKYFFSSKFMILSRYLPRRRSPAEIAARWRYRPLRKNLTAYCDSQFCVSFHFCFYHESQKRLQTCQNGAYTYFFFFIFMLISSYKELVQFSAIVCWTEIVMVIPSLPSYLVMHFRWFSLYWTLGRFSLWVAMSIIRM